MSAPVQSYPAGVTGADHIAHDMRVGRFPTRSEIPAFLEERALYEAGWTIQNDGSSWLRLADGDEPANETFGNGRRAILVPNAAAAWRWDNANSLLSASKTLIEAAAAYDESEATETRCFDALDGLKAAVARMEASHAV